MQRSRADLMNAIPVAKDKDQVVNFTASLIDSGWLCSKL